jgi:hypothetical protein
MSDALDRWSGLLFEEVDGYRPTPVFEWANGQLRAARLCFDVEELEDSRGEPREGVEAITAVLDHPSLRELTVGIQLAGDLEVTMQPVVDIIAARPRPSLRSLSLLARPMDYPFAWDDELYVDLGDLSGLWPKLPALERLVLHAESLQLGEVSLPQLRTLEVLFTDEHANECHSLIGAHWPSLENVALHVGDTQFGSDATTEDLAGILERLPQLRNLAIIGFNDDEQLIRWLSSSPILRQLHTLSLTGTLEFASVEQVGAKPRFRQLRVDAGPLRPSPPNTRGAIYAPVYDMNEWRRRF